MRGNSSGTWPWEANELVPKQAMPDVTAPRTSKDGQWILEHTLIGQYCLARGGENLRHPVKNLICSGQRYYNATSRQSVWQGSRKERNPLARVPGLTKAWHNPGRVQDWTALRGLSWICGSTAFIRLPTISKGSCVIGTIKPSLSSYL